MKRIGILVVLMVFCATVHVYAADINVTVDGVKVDFDTPPIMENDRTFIPVSYVSECLDYEVSWNGETGTATIMNMNEVLELKVGSTSYWLGNEEKKMDAAPFIKNDRTMVPLRVLAETFRCTVDWEQDSKTVVIKKPVKEYDRTVTVSTAKEFLESIQSNTTIILNEGVYNLSEVDDVANKSIAKSEVFDGYEYTINAVNGLEIKASENAEVTIVVEPRYANVLSFERCSNILLSDFIAGHTVEEGYCTGGVVRLDDTTDISIKNCKFYGCGTYGIIGDNSNTIRVSNTDIYECTYGALDMTDCNNVDFNSCVFRDCAGFSLFVFRNCNKINVTDSLIKNNENGTDFNAFILEQASNDIVFNNCKFENNQYKMFTNNETILFNHCTIE